MNKLRRMHKVWIISTALTLVLAGVGLYIVHALRPHPIPPQITKQMNFAAFVPGADQATIEPSSIKYNSSEQMLYFTAKTPDNATLLISQQPTPQSFSDIPQAYDKLVEQMGQYAALDTINGKIYLTKPRNSQDKQIGVSNNRGTLLFIRTEHELSEDTWRQFFNSLVLTK